MADAAETLRLLFQTPTLTRANVSECCEIDNIEWARGIRTLDLCRVKEAQADNDGPRWTTTTGQTDCPDDDEQPRT
jgi:hypothetical protein